MDPIGLKLRKLRKLNRESVERRTAPNISKIYENNHIVKNLEKAFAEIDRMREKP